VAAALSVAAVSVSPIRNIGLAGAALLAAAASVQFGIALYIPAKAALAQVLLRSAWAVTTETGDAVRPWPWADTHPVARLRIARLGIDQIVLAGATGRTLAFGPAQLDAGVAPGGPGHAIVAGHRDTHFFALRDLRIGDEIAAERPGGQTLTYRVAGIAIADARHQRIALAPDENRLTLVTCFPFDAIDPGGPLRFVVTALAPR
jgi:sortase A